MLEACLLCALCVPGTTCKEMEPRESQVPLSRGPPWRDPWIMQGPTALPTQARGGHVSGAEPLPPVAKAETPFGFYYGSLWAPTHK